MRSVNWLKRDFNDNVNFKKKIVSRAALKKIVARERKKGKTIAFTNGCFDIIHYGHVSYLTSAKKDKRVLVVGVNSDASIRAIKGPHRPIITEKARAAVLAAFACVDYVTIFKEPTPYRLIKALQPDILVKGADWKGKAVVGSDIVRQRGGKVEFIKFVDRYSTTEIIESILKKCT